MIRKVFEYGIRFESFYQRPQSVIEISIYAPYITLQRVHRLTFCLLSDHVSITGATPKEPWIKGYLQSDSTFFYSGTQEFKGAC